MIALDATYSAGRNLSGVGVYSREILEGLAREFPQATWEWFYRSNRFFRAGEQPRNVRKRLLWETVGSRRAELFHGLNQRLPKRGFRKQIATFHDLFVLTADYSSLEFRERFAEQARHAAQASDLVIAVSSFTAAQVEAYLNVPRSRLRVVPHGILPRPLVPVPREDMVLCVGAIQRRKNQARLVRAFAALPSHWTLVLAGSMGFGAEETVKAVEASPARERIRIIGYADDAELAQLYSRARVFAFPSLDEGFGMPVLEAMASGIPVLAGNTSALPEVCGDAALLVDSTDENAIAEGLLRFARDPDLRRKFRELGAIHASRYSWRKTVLDTAKVYREMSKASGLPTF